MVKGIRKKVWKIEIFIPLYNTWGKTFKKFIWIIPFRKRNEKGNSGRSKEWKNKEIKEIKEGKIWIHGSRRKIEINNER